MRVAGGNGLGLGQAHLAQQGDHALRVLGRRQRAVQGHRLQQLPPDAQCGRQRLAGVLRHQRHLAAADRLQRRPRQAEHLALTKMHTATHHPQARLKVAHGRQGQRALAGATLSHQPHGLAAPDL